MSSVTSRISEIAQPYGGFLPINTFEYIQLEDNTYINSQYEYIHPSRIGLTVDYLTRFMVTKDLRKSFEIPLLGAAIANQTEVAEKLLKKVKGLDDKSIQAACTLTGYDVFYRDLIYVFTMQNYSHYFLNERVNAATKRNIRHMVERAVSLFDNYGPVLMSGFTFDGGYSDVVSAADADFLSKDTLWDFKVSTKKRPTSKDTLQLLVYYVMGCHSIYSDLFKNLSYIAIYNPRYNHIFRFKIKLIPKAIIDEIENNVICYGKTKSDVIRQNHLKQRQKVKDGKMLDTRETSEFLMIPPKALTSLNKNGILHPVKYGSKNYYNPDELKAYYFNYIRKIEVPQNSNQEEVAP